MRTHLISDSNPNLGERIQRLPLTIKVSGRRFIEGQRSRCRMVRDSLPAEIVRSIEPDRQAFVFTNKFAISFKRPGSAAERNDARCLPVQNYLQGGSFSIAETRFSALFDQLRHAHVLLCGNDGVQIGQAAAKTRSESLSHGRFA